MPFPTTFPDAGLSSVVAYLRGSDVPARVALEGAYDLEGYALGQIVANPTPSPLRTTATPAPFNGPQLADELEHALRQPTSPGRAAGLGGFDWASLLTKVQQIIPILIALLS